MRLKTPRRKQSDFDLTFFELSGLIFIFINPLLMTLVVSKLVLTNLPANL